jgi:hypothetical protein
MAILGRLLPGSSLQLVPALAQYAHAPGAPEELRTILSENPGLKRPLLIALASKAENADLVIKLAAHDVLSSAPDARAWKSRLLASLVDRGEYRRAYVLWHLLSGLPAGQSPLVFNSQFNDNRAPPPFNWSYSSGSAGLAEPADGKLRVLFYGRTNSVMASQLLLLTPGSYKFKASESGEVADGALVWALSCLDSGKELMSLPIGKSAESTFTVPAQCGAQRLDLNGVGLEQPEQSDVEIGPVLVEKVEI